MAISRTAKEKIVSDLKNKMAKSSALVFARFHGLSVAKISEFRRKMRTENGEYTVAKKSLLKIALADSGKEVPSKFEGEVGVVSGYGDELAVFRGSIEFSKKEKDAFKILGGFFEGKFVDADIAERIGRIPGREALYAQLMGVVLGNTRKLVYVLDQVSKRG